MGRKGQVVIPKAIREGVRLEPGDEVTVSLEGDAIRVERVVSPDALMGRLAGHWLVALLERDRQAERHRRARSRAGSRWQAAARYAKRGQHQRHAPHGPLSRSRQAP